MMLMRNDFVVKVKLKLSFEDAQQLLGILKNRVLDSFIINPFPLFIFKMPLFFEKN